MRSLLSASKLIRLYLNSNKNSNLFSNQLSSKFNFIRSYRFDSKMSSADDQYNDPMEPFKPKRVLVLHKFSRYEFEKRRNPGLTEEELMKNLESRGSDYQQLISHHNIHKQSREHIIASLKSVGIESKIVNRTEYNDKMIEWADLIISSGGDGTFLMAASKVNNRNKPLIGLNSDPKRSVGYLCLPKRYCNNFGEALRLMTEGKFKWKYRQRIRVILEGENANEEPLELHEIKQKCPENRFLDMEMSQDSNPKSNDNNQNKNRKVLPFRALNEVFVGESISSRVSYYEFSVNDKTKTKLRSSGLTVCTGTGSTSWFFNINKVTPQCVKSLFQIINEELKDQNLPENDFKLIERVANKFNNSLIFDPSELSMAYTIRDPVVFGHDFDNSPRGFAKTISIKSRMTDANIVIDGGLSYKFNDGSNVTFEILEEDALRTIALKE